MYGRKRQRRKKTHLPYRRRRFLCTDGEWRFCQKLEEAVGDRFTVMMQVRVGSLLETKTDDWKSWGRRVSQKSFDFVLVQRGSSFAAAAIELDDKTHLLPERRKRDKFLDQACERAGLPLIRFKTARRYDVDEIRNVVKASLPKKACEVRPNDAPPPLLDGTPIGWVWNAVA